MDDDFSDLPADFSDLPISPLSAEEVARLAPEERRARMDLILSYANDPRLADDGYFFIAELLALDRLEGSDNA